MIIKGLLILKYHALTINNLLFVTFHVKTYKYTFNGSSNFYFVS